jgi:dihydropteroate synthase
MATDRIYLRPRALISGVDAARAITQGGGLPLANTGVAFTQCEVISRSADGLEGREILAAPALAQYPSDGPAGAALSRLTSPHTSLRLDTTSLAFDRPLVMGVLNVTPDSFSGDGLAGNLSGAIEQGRKLINEGADILDVGGESTRPGAAPVDPYEECARVLPVITALGDLGVPISIDTRRAQVMEQAVAAGASLINDVSALNGDPGSLAAAAASGAAVILNHMRGTPRDMQDTPSYDDVLLDVYDALEARVDAAIGAGIPRERLIVDPGLGFGKTVAHNYQLIDGLGIFHGLGCPVLVGASRKSFIGAVAGDVPADARLPGSLAAVLAAVHHGANVVRVHDVAETHQALAIWKAVGDRNRISVPHDG